MRTLLSVALAGLVFAAPSAGQAAREVKPRAIKEVKPQYTPEAMRAGVQGSVLLNCEVRADGTVGDVRVTKPLDRGLDEQAVKAVKQWRFKPGTLDGKPVPVRVSIEMTFTLRSSGQNPTLPKPPNGRDGR